MKIEEKFIEMQKQQWTCWANSLKQEKKCTANLTAHVGDEMVHTCQHREATTMLDKHKHRIYLCSMGNIDSRQIMVGERLK